MSAPRGLLWPLILVSVGVVFLLANLGYLPPFSVGRALALVWPFALVLFGVEIALSRRRPWLALLAEVAIIATAVGLVATRADVAISHVGQSSITIEREDAQRLDLSVDVGAGEISIRGGASRLIEATSAGGGLEQRVTRRDGAADVRLSRESLFPGPSGFGDFDVRIATGVPTALVVNGGAGSYDVDLSDVEISSARISTGASSYEITLPRPRGDVPVRIDAGASSIEIETNGVEYRVRSSTGLSSVDGPLESPGYATATDRVTITVSAGLSSIDIH